MKRRILGILLAVCLVVAGMPQTAFAAGSTAQEENRQKKQKVEIAR